MYFFQEAVCEGNLTSFFALLIQNHNNGLIQLSIRSTKVNVYNGLRAMFLGRPSGGAFLFAQSKMINLDS